MPTIKQTRIDLVKLNLAAEASGKNATAIAFELGVSRGGVLSWLDGTATPSAINLKKLCDLFGLKIEDMFIEEIFERQAA